MSTVRIPPPLRDATDGQQVVVAGGGTIGDLLDDLVSRYPALDGQLQHANVYVDGEDIRVLDKLETPVDDTSTVILLPAMAGGAVHVPGT
jgi:molybdopterin converting factor small subunit